MHIKKTTFKTLVLTEVFQVKKHRTQSSIVPYNYPYFVIFGLKIGVTKGQG